MCSVARLRDSRAAYFVFLCQRSGSRNCANRMQSSRRVGKEVIKPRNLYTNKQNLVSAMLCVWDRIPSVIPISNCHLPIPVDSFGSSEKPDNCVGQADALCDSSLPPYCPPGTKYCLMVLLIIQIRRCFFYCTLQILVPFYLSISVQYAARTTC